MYLGVPVPEVIIIPELTTITHSTEANTHATRRPSHSQKRFVQVDVQLYDAPSQFEWKVFSYAYGDLYNILKIGVQPFGFTLRPSGLFLRIAEIDAINKDASPVFLTNDVQLVLEFFGLDFQRYNQGFDNLEELFGYATSSHLFSRLQFSLQNASLKPGTSPTCEEVAKPSILGKYCRKRASWVQFTEQWLPSHPEIGTTFDENDKSTIHANALQIFDREPLYWKKLNAFRTKQGEEKFWMDVKEHIMTFADPKPSSDTNLNNIIQALHMWVIFSAEFGNVPRPIIAKEAQMDASKYALWIEGSEEGGFTKDELLGWILVHQRELYELERSRTREIRHAKRAAQEERKAKRLLSEQVAAMSDEKEQAVEQMGRAEKDFGDHLCQPRDANRWYSLIWSMSVFGILIGVLISAMMVALEET